MTYRIAFVLAATQHGLMIVNRLDQHSRPLTEAEGGGILLYGVSTELLEQASYSADEILPGIDILNRLRQHRGKDRKIHMIDCGANIGTHTLAWAHHMRGWGEVTAYEPQRELFYALCGNIAINNLTANTIAINKAIGDSDGFIEIPRLNYYEPGSYGSLELVKSIGEGIGQKVDYDHTIPIEIISLDESFAPHLDFLKVDVEGMELDVLKGAEQVIDKCKPVIMLEWIKSDQEALADWLQYRNYDVMALGRHGWVAIHTYDPIRDMVAKKK